MKFFDIIEFDWDENNKYKSFVKHGVNNSEAEDAFFDPDGKIFKTKDERFIHLGVSSSGKYLFQVFEYRGKNKVRIISSRLMEKKEKKNYKNK